MPDMGFTVVNPRSEQEDIAYRLHPGQADPALSSLATEVLLIFLLDSGQGGPDVETPFVYPQHLSCVSYCPIGHVFRVYLMPLHKSLSLPFPLPPVKPLAQQTCLLPGPDDYCHPRLSHLLWGRCDR